MSYDCPDFVQDATELLTQVGYTFHERTEDNDGQGDATVHWFAWTDGKMDIEVGEDCPDPLVATMTALRHWCTGARILSVEEEELLESDPPEDAAAGDDKPCTNPDGHVWNRTAGEADEARIAHDYANDNIRCIYCGADGDA